MNIGIVITRIGGVDGVALETEKWIEVLKKLGHKIHIITGQLEREIPNTELFEPLYLYSKISNTEQRMAFFRPVHDDLRLEKYINKNVQVIENRLLKWILKNKIECLVSQNASCLPCHLSMGIAIANVIRDTGIKHVFHHHDFVWERKKRYFTKSKFIKKKIAECFPPVDTKGKTVVINRYNQSGLKSRHGIRATLVPNVMDFNKKFARVDSYNKKFRQDLGFAEDDILLGQVTRIVERKGIETAIELVAKLNNPKVKLIITGYERDAEPGYVKKLRKLAKDLYISRQVFFIGKRVDHWRRMDDGKKVYSLSDVYAHLNACTYFSTYEGFGNAFVECILAKKPIFVNNYEPVYWPDIGSKGFKTVQVEKSKLKNEHVEQVRKILENKKVYEKIVSHNFKLGKKHFSFQVLEKLLKKVFK